MCNEMYILLNFCNVQCPVLLQPVLMTVPDLMAGVNAWTEPASGKEYVFAFGGKTPDSEEDGSRFIER